jgi:hypothetical protein
MMAESINYLAQHVSVITPVTHIGGDRLLQKYIKGDAFHELPTTLREEATALFREAISSAYWEVHNLRSHGIHAEIDPEAQNFIIQHSAGKITDIHWIDAVSGVIEHSPTK